MSQSHSLPYWLTILLLFTCNIGAYGQDATVKLITYPAPSDNFVDIKVQSHEDLPRYGMAYFTPGQPANFNLRAFGELVKLKYLSAQYADMNRNLLTKYDQYRGSQDKKILNSYDTQNHLKRLAQELCSEALLIQYFCDSDAANTCVFLDQGKQRKVTANWGGFRPNEFKQIRSYTSFVKEHLDELVKWSETFFKNNEQLVYYVQQSTVVGRYDFQKKGFWINSTSVTGGNHFLDLTELALSGPDEQKLRQQQIFMPLAQDRAKTLSQQKKAHFMYLVFKVKIKAKPLMKMSDKFSAELAAPVIQVYLDQQLTEKLTEISIPNLISRP